MVGGHSDMELLMTRNAREAAEFAISVFELAQFRGVREESGQLFNHVVGNWRHMLKERGKTSGGLGT